MIQSTSWSSDRVRRTSTGPLNHLPYRGPTPQTHCPMAAATATVSAAHRSLAGKPKTAASFVTSRELPSLFPRLHPVVPISGFRRRAAAVRCSSSRPTSSPLNDPSPNWSNRPPKETILLDGCDFEHWLVVMEPPEENASRDDIIDSYIKTLAQVVGRYANFCFDCSES